MRGKKHRRNRNSIKHAKERMPEHAKCCDVVVIGYHEKNILGQYTVGLGNEYMETSREQNQPTYK